MRMLFWILAAAALVLLLYWLGGLRNGRVHAGELAPDFSLPGQDGRLHALADYRGHWLVLYFYPKDDTPGCTREACAFRDGLVELGQLDARVVGVSVDDADSHRAFAERHGLPFPLLSDTSGEVAARYGALWALGPLKFARRHSFLIDPQGRLRRIYRRVDPDRHFRELVEGLKTLQRGERSST
ncbi:peroxiredoxin [Thiohalobacter sp.]|uniref:peroxiredoxin n=1 Tax=Thiohalobacter sp. TaxID=2025948 RepID=UPI0026197D87|nr:peroxiredoxin [Thiohalobacter sp.]